MALDLRFPSILSVALHWEVEGKYEGMSIAEPLAKVISEQLQQGVPESNQGAASRVKCNTPRIIGQAAGLQGWQGPQQGLEVEYAAEGFARPVVETVGDGIKVILRVAGQVTPG